MNNTEGPIGSTSVLQSPNIHFEFAQVKFLIFQWVDHAHSLCFPLLLSLKILCTLRPLKTRVNLCLFHDAFPDPANYLLDKGWMWKLNEKRIYDYVMTHGDILVNGILYIWQWSHKMIRELKNCCFLVRSQLSWYVILECMTHDL
jgi:hypothetical protein